MQTYEPHILKLQTLEGFLELFWQLCQEYPTHEKSYEAAERQYKSYFGENKYSNFNSFRTVRDRFLKSNKKHKI